MVDLSQLESTYRHFVDHLYDLIPEGVITIDLPELQSLGLLRCSEEEAESRLPALQRRFQVLESSEKITLFNQQFIIWLVPQEGGEQSRTLALVALNRKEGAKLELAFEACGAYNTSKRVLIILEQYLAEIQENEALLSTFD